MTNSVILHFVSSFNDSMIYRIAFRFNYAPSIKIFAFNYIIITVEAIYSGHIHNYNY